MHYVERNRVAPDLRKVIDQLIIQSAVSLDSEDENRGKPWIWNDEGPQFRRSLRLGPF